MNLEIRSLQCQIGKFILGPLDLTLRQEDYLILVGPSGSGKTTLLRTIAGLIAAQTGSIKFQGRDFQQLTPEKRKIGMLFQNLALWPHLSVEQHLDLVLRYQQLSKRQIKERVTSILQQMHLLDKTQRKPAELSGGEAQRLALARALATEPQLLLLDEPFGPLDTHLRTELAEEVIKIHKTLKAPVIHVSHDPMDLLAENRQIALMRSGRIEQFGTLDDMLQKPNTPFVAQFFRPIHNLMKNLQLMSRASQ